MEALAVVPAVVAAAGLIGVLVNRRWLVRAVVVAAAVSLATTVALLLAGGLGESAVNLATGAALVETLAFLALTTLAVRTSPPRVAVLTAGLATVAMATWILRFGPPTVIAFGGMAVWVLPAVVAIGAGLYLRSLDDARVRTVEAARQAQRLRLARDLHDFVAHDVSEILAQAQAGQIAPSEAATVLQNIERASLRALASMDRTVHMLHEPDTLAPPEKLADLPDLAARFTASGSATVRLELDPGLALPREVAATVYRVVVEALTNVRRHAPSAGEVVVDVRRVAGAVVVTVTNDGAASPGTRQGGGRGIPGLAERVRALGGTLDAGPTEPGGWRLTASLPVSPPVEAG